MIKLVKLIIWIAGLLVVSYAVLTYLGYEVNKEYFSSAKKQCEEKAKQCGSDIIHQGTDNATCDVKCVDPNIIIRKK